MCGNECLEAEVVFADGNSPMIRIACLIALLATAQQIVRYEKIILHDGQVITGQVEQEDAKELMVRVIKAGGKVNYVRRVPKHLIFKRQFVELPQLADPSPTEKAEAPQAADQDELADVSEYLKSIFSEWEIRNVQEAARRLLKLLNQASPEQLAALDEQTRRRHDISLARFAAQVHFKYALDRSEQGVFRMYFLTHFTLGEAHGLLAEALPAALEAQVTCQGHPVSGTKCQRVDSISQWIDQPARYHADALHATRFGQQVSRVMGMNRELVRLCQALRRDRQEILDLNSEQERLRKLLAVVNQRKYKLESGH